MPYYDVGDRGEKKGRKGNGQFLTNPYYVSGTMLIRFCASQPDAQAQPCRTLSACMTLSKLLNLSAPHLPFLYDRDNNAFYFIELL